MTSAGPLATAPAEASPPPPREESPADEIGATGLVDLLGRLGFLDVRLTADGGTLHFDAPDGVVTDDLLARLRAHKAELLRFLAARDGEPQPESSGPATHGQRRMRARYLVAGNPAAFNVAQRVELTGPLDVPALGRALTALLRRQSVLRSRFTAYGDEVVQEVMPLVPVRLDVTDLRDLPADERGLQATGRVRRLAVTPFDLSVAPLLRADVLRTGDEDFTLTLVVHHIAIDGWGLGVLMGDLGALYAAALRVPGPRPPTDEEAGLAPLPVSFAEAARGLREHLSGQRLELLRSYWRKALAGAPMTMELPYDRPRPERPTGAGGQVRMRLARELTDRLQALARGWDTTVFTVLLSAWGTLLCRLTGGHEVVVACNIANRIRREHEPLVGLFTNNVALRLGSADAAHGGAGAAAAVADAARTFFSAADHQEYPLAMLLEECLDPDATDAARFPQTVIVLESQGVPVLDLPGVAARVSDVPIEGSVSDLCLVLTPDADGMEMLVLYSRDRFEHTTVERWAGDYVALLREYLSAAAPSA